MHTTLQPSILARVHPVLGANRFNRISATVVIAVVGVGDRLLTVVFKPLCRPLCIIQGEGWAEPRKNTYKD